MQSGADIVISGRESSFDHTRTFGLGSAVAVGDVDADGKEDMLLGAPDTVQEVPGGSVEIYGQGFLVYGAPRIALPHDFHLCCEFGTTAINGAGPGANLGKLTAIGNVNGDSFNDVLLGLPVANPPVLGYSVFGVGGVVGVSDDPRAQTGRLKLTSHTLSDHGVLFEWSGVDVNTTRLSIFDAMGRRVFDTGIARGVSQFVLDGEAGAPNTSGHYFARVESSGLSATISFVFLSNEEAGIHCGCRIPKQLVASPE